MPKLPHQSTVPPAETLDSVNKDYGDTNYLSGGAGGGAGIESLNLVSASSQYAEIVDASSNGALEGMANLTIEGWFRPASVSSASGLVCKYSGVAGNYSYRWRLESATSMSVTISTDGTAINSVTRTFNGGTTAVVGEWIHLAFSWNGSTGDVIFYVNGVQQGAVAAGFPTGTIFDGTAPFRVGNDELGNSFGGDVAHVRVWGVVKPQTEIADDMVRTLTGDEIALIAYYRFDGNFNDSAGNNPLSGVNSPVFNDVVPVGAPAQSLVTKGNTVTISGSAQPTVGQALVATSSSSAEWQTVATGTLDTALGAYASKTMGGDMVDAVAPAQVPLDTVIVARGDIDTSGNTFVVKPGRTYLLHAQTRTLDGTFATIVWYDLTASAIIGKASVWDAVNANFHSTSVHAVFSPTVESTIELRVSGAAGSPNLQATVTSASVVEIGAVQADVIGGLEFMDMVEVTGSAVTGVTFGAGGDGIYGRALDGDMDEQYVVIGTIDQAISPINIELNPNGSTTGLSSEINDTIGGGNFPVSHPEMRVIGSDNGVGSTMIFEAKLHAKTGLRRAFMSHGSVLGATDRTQIAGGGWQDTAANITTLEVNCVEGTAGIGVGSRFFLYRRTRNNLRADTAAVYERQVTAVVAQGTATEELYTTGAATFGGSALGISARMVDDDVTAGTIDVALKVGGVTVMTAQLNTTNTTYARAAGVVSQFPVVFGDDIEVGVTVTGLTTTGGGSPALAINIMLANDAYVQPRIGSDYLYARLSADQTTNLAAGNHVEFDTAASRGSSISMQTGAGQLDGLFDLKAGKVYEIDFRFLAEVNEGSINLQLYNHGTETAMTDITGLACASTHGHDNVATDVTNMSGSVTVIAPTTDVTVKMEIFASTNPVRMDATRTHIWIKELK